MAKNDLSTFLARSRPTIQSWITTATAASVTRIVTQNYITNTVDLTGYITTTAGDIRYYPRTELDAAFAGVIENSHEQEHDITSSDHTALGADLGMVILAGGVLEMEDGSTVEMEDGTDLDLEIDTLGWGYLDHSNLTGVNADDHHDPVTIADATHFSLSGQILSAGADLALQDIDNQWQVSQNITGALTASTNITATNGDITATNGNIAATNGTLYAGSTITAGTNVIATNDVTAKDNLIVWDKAAIGGGSDEAVSAHALDVEGSTALNGDVWLGTGSTHSSGAWWHLDSVGRIIGLDPLWTIEGDGSRDGTIIAPDFIGTQFMDMRHGTMAVQVLEIDSVRVSGGSEWWVPGSSAALIADTATPTTDFVIVIEMEDDTDLELEDGTTLDLEAGYGAISLPVKNPQIGTMQQYFIGERIEIKGFVLSDASNLVGAALHDPGNALSLGIATLRNGFALATIYATVIDYTLTVHADGDYYTYTALLDNEYLGDDGILPMGTAIAGFKRPSATKREGLMLMQPGFHSNYGPYLLAATLGGVDNGTEAGTDTGDWWDQRHVGWFGNLQGAENGQADEFGLMAGLNLADSTAAYIVASNQRLEMYGPAATWSDDDGIYTTIDTNGINVAATYASGDFPGIADPVRQINWYDDLTALEKKMASIGVVTQLPNLISQFQVQSGTFDDSGPAILQLSAQAREGMGGITIKSAQPNGDSLVSISADNISASGGDLSFASANIYLFSNRSGLLKLLISDLPKSATGLQAGQVWNDGGTLKIV